MTKTDLIAQVAANTEMSKKSAELAVNAAFEALGKAMAEGEKITISAVEKKNVQELSVSLNEKIDAEKRLISELDLLKADHDKTQKTLEETFFCFQTTRRLKI